MKTTVLEPRLVQSAPDELEAGVLYISLKYANVLHLCCCGCGTEVATPLSPARWKLTFDGESVSLWPSVGNWSTACRSHYIIRENAIIDCAPWSDRRIAEGRKADGSAIKKHLEDEPEARSNRRPLHRLLSWLRRVLPPSTPQG